MNNNKRSSIFDDVQPNQRSSQQHHHRAYQAHGSHASVVVLTDYNFDGIVFDKSHHVLVEFYAPWCGHCQKVEPVYDQLGRLYGGRGDIVVARVDGSIYRFEHTHIETFPTIKLYKKGSNQVVDYHGSRSLESLERFLQKNCRTEEHRESRPQGAASDISVNGPVTRATMHR